jgi:hypothetical protein
VVRGEENKEVWGSLHHPFENYRKVAEEGALGATLNPVLFLKFKKTNFT